MDVRAAGYWHHAMITPDKQKFWNRLDYKPINPIAGCTAQDAFCDESGSVNPKLPGSLWNVAFADRAPRSLATTLIQIRL